MERKKAHYLRDIIREEELMKYASKAGVTSFQKSVVKTYMKGINESQLAAKYDVMTNAIHEASDNFMVQQFIDSDLGIDDLFVKGLLGE